MIPEEDGGARAGFPWVPVMVLTTSNGEQGLFMFFCSLSLIFQSACSTSSDFLAPSLVSPAQQCGAVQGTLQGGAFQAALQGESRKLWIRRREQGQDFSEVLAGSGAQWPQPAWQLPSPRAGCPCSKPPWTPSMAVQLSQP